MEILELELSDHACLHGCDRSGVLGGVGATEGQLAILAVVGRRGLKRHGNKVRWDGPLAEQVIGDCGDGGIFVWRQCSDGQVYRSDPWE